MSHSDDRHLPEDSMQVGAGSVGNGKPSRPMSPKIKSVTIGPMPKGLMDPMPSVTAKFEDGTERKLFHFYPDELKFQESEFLGLTESEAHALRHSKDMAYLKSP